MHMVAVADQLGRYLIGRQTEANGLKDGGETDKDCGGPCGPNATSLQW